MKNLALLFAFLFGQALVFGQLAEDDVYLNDIAPLYISISQGDKDSVAQQYAIFKEKKNSSEVRFLGNVFMFIYENNYSFNYDLFKQDIVLDDRNDWDYITNMLYNVAQNSFKNKDLYYATMEAGEYLAAEFKKLEQWHGCQSGQTIMAAMARDLDKMAVVIKRMGFFPYGDDSIKYVKYIRQKALYNELTSGDSTDYYFLKTIDIAKRHVITQSDSAMLSGTYSAYGNIIIKRGNLNEAAPYLLEANKMLPSNKIFALNKAELTINLSNTYLNLSNTKKALEYAHEAERMCEEYNFTKMRDGKCAHLFGDIYYEMGELDKSIFEHKKSYQLYSTKWISSFQPRLLALKLSRVYASVNDIENYEYWKKESMKYDKTNDEIEILSHLGPAYINFNQSKYKEALENVQIAFKKANAIQAIKYQRESLDLLYKINKKNKNFITALAYLESYIQLEDSLYRSGQELAISELQNSFELNIKEEQINTLNAHNEVTQTKLKAQKNLTIMTTFGLILLTGLLLSQVLFYKKLKAKNSLITKANEEKNVLLKEIHHRVKNNLQVISSLLKLQSRYIKDDSAVKAIAEGRTRVQSMALLHQNLYQDDNLKGVNMKNYFDNLIQGLFEAYNIEEDRITLNTNIQPLMLDVDTVIPLGLITNELISNALKHAFGKEQKGTIYVELKELDKELILIVKDNGIGKDNKIVSDGEHKSFGQMLVQSLSTKLEARIEENYNEGTEIKLKITDYKIAA